MKEYCLPNAMPVLCHWKLKNMDTSKEAWGNTHTIRFSLILLLRETFDYLRTTTTLVIHKSIQTADVYVGTAKKIQRTIGDFWGADTAYRMLLFSILSSLTNCDQIYVGKALVKRYNWWTRYALCAFAKAQLHYKNLKKARLTDKKEGCKSKSSKAHLCGGVWLEDTWAASLGLLSLKYFATDLSSLDYDRFSLSSICHRYKSDTSFHVFGARMWEDCSDILVVWSYTRAWTCSICNHVGAASCHSLQAQASKRRAKPICILILARIL